MASLRPTACSEIMEDLGPPTSDFRKIRRKSRKSHARYRKVTQMRNIRKSPTIMEKYQFVRVDGLSIAGGYSGPGTSKPLVTPLQGSRKFFQTSKSLMLHSCKFLCHESRCSWQLADRTNGHFDSEQIFDDLRHFYNSSHYFP